MANISPRAKLNYDSDTFSVDFNVAEYSPEVSHSQSLQAAQLEFESQQSWRAVYGEAWVLSSLWK